MLLKLGVVFLLLGPFDKLITYPSYIVIIFNCYILNLHKFFVKDTLKILLLFFNPTMIF